MAWLLLSLACLIVLYFDNREDNKTKIRMRELDLQELEIRKNKKRKKDDEG